MEDRGPLLIPRRARRRARRRNKSDAVEQNGEGRDHGVCLIEHELQSSRSHLGGSAAANQRRLRVPSRPLADLGLRPRSVGRRRRAISVACGGNPRGASPTRDCSAVAISICRRSSRRGPSLGTLTFSDFVSLHVQPDQSFAARLPTGSRPVSQAEFDLIVASIRDAAFEEFGPRANSPSDCARESSRIRSQG